jgi:hypothetical protein
MPSTELTDWRWCYENAETFVRAAVSHFDPKPSEAQIKAAAAKVVRAFAFLKKREDR